MQVFGTKAIESVTAELLGRAQRQLVASWLGRVVPRHVRRSADLLVPIRDRATLVRLMREDGVLDEAVSRLLAEFEEHPTEFRMPRDLRRCFLPRAIDVIDWIHSLRSDDRRIRRIDRMSWTDAVEHSERWHRSLANARRISGNLMAGTRKIAEFEGGAFVVELETAAALREEGAAMGHCVGGYWASVHAGEAKIISVRDAVGRPHVTVELRKPPSLSVHGLEEPVLVSRAPPNGVSRLYLASAEWTPTQVRGKQNKQPIEKWGTIVDRYFNEMGMFWPMGKGNADSYPNGPTVYTVDQISYIDSGDAMDAGMSAIIAKVGRGHSLGRVYAASGLREIHSVAAHRHADKVGTFLRKVVPYSFAAADAPHSMVSPRLALARHRHGVVAVLSEVARVLPNGGIDARREVFSILARDVGDVTTSRERLLSMGRVGIDVLVHRFPTRVLAMLGAGIASGFEDDAVQHLERDITLLVQRIADAPNAAHAIVPADGAVSPSEIVQAVIASGLAAAWSAAICAVDSGVRNARRELLLAARRERSRVHADPSEINKVVNMLADGFEARIEETIRSLHPGTAMVIGAIVPRRPTAHLRPTSASIVKRYAMPTARASSGCFPPR